DRMEREKLLPPPLAVVSEAHALDAGEEELDRRARGNLLDLSALVEELKPLHVEVREELYPATAHVADSLAGFAPQAIEIQAPDWKKLEVGPHRRGDPFREGPGLRKLGFELLEEVARPLFHDLRNDFLLRAEEIVEGPRGHPRLAHNVGDACLLVMLFRGEAQDGIEEAPSLHLSWDRRS